MTCVISYEGNMKEIFATYCAVNENGEHEVLITDEKNCQEYKNWKERYTKSLRVFYNIEQCEDKDDCENKDIVREFYCDPDTTYYGKLRNPQFFYELERFLNKREQALQNKLCETFIYKFVERKGIEVLKKNKNKEKHLFYLRSDQLGFSAPTNKKEHPYDLFIELSIDQSKDKAVDAINQTAKWIAESRTLGGSFLWPIPFYYKYNSKRGGKTTSSDEYYIQDRVDLTLLELKYQYKVYQDFQNSGVSRVTIMDRHNDSNLDIWLKHFKDFKTYIEFFCFDPFVKNDWPIDILGEENTLCFKEFESENKKIKIPKKKFIGEEFPEYNIDFLKKILERVNGCIKERTTLMNNFL